MNTFTIDELIKTKNPFAGHIVVRPQQIWGKSFPDVPSIHAHASNAVFDAVKKVKQGQRETVGITIEAERGLGKSHIISRIRHGLQSDGAALFMYMSKYDNLNHIKYEFCQTIASSLRSDGKNNVMQWQEIAAALLNEARGWNYTPEQYIKQIYPTWLNKYSTSVINNITEAVLKIKPHVINPYIIRAILWTLSSVHATYAVYWLSGLEITQQQADILGLPNPKSTDREADALSMARQILDIVSDYKIPVICFDELDAIDVDDNGFLTAQLVANLVKDLYNSLKKGVFLLTMYPDTWEAQINTLPQTTAIIDRIVSEQPDRRPIKLNHLNSDDVVSIVQQWLKDFYEENKVVPIHSLYPFNEEKLREIGRKNKPTVRSILKWCAENFSIPEVHPVEAPFQNELKNVEADINSLMEDEAAIANALRLAFHSLIGETLEGVKIEAVENVEASSADRGIIDFKIIGNNQKVKIGVDVVQQAGGANIGAALKRLIDYKKFDLTRGCLVRSKQISSSAAVARQRLQVLLKQQGGEWVKLRSEDIKPLIAISFVAKGENYELPKELIIDFINKKKLAIDNALIREILSDPSGQEPDNLTDDELPMRIPQANFNLSESLEPELVGK